MKGGRSQNAAGLGLGVPALSAMKLRKRQGTRFQGRGRGGPPASSVDSGLTSGLPTIQPELGGSPPMTTRIKLLHVLFITALHQSTRIYLTQMSALF